MNLKRLERLPLFLLSALARSSFARAESHAHGTRIADLKPVRLSEPLKVTTTVNMVDDLARVIGGNRVQVTELMGPGVDPHLFKASARDMQKLMKSDLMLYGGLHLEGKMVELLEKNRKAIAVTQGIPENKLIQPQGGVDSVLCR